MFLTTIKENCDRLADKTAIEFILPDGTSESVTFGELEQQVQRAMAFLQANDVQAGDRVALQLPKCLPFIYLHLATMRLGAISLPLNPGYPARELSYFLNDAEPCLFFASSHHQQAGDLQSDLQSDLQNLRTIVLDGTTADFADIIGQEHVKTDVPLPENADETALILYSSGTTGQPKGVQLTHGNLTANSAGLQSAWGWQEDDILLHVLPIYHGHGLPVALYGALYAGATTIMMAKFEPEQALRLMVKKRCTVFMAVPTIHKRLVEFEHAADYDLSHMRLLTSGSDRLPDDVNLKFQQIFGHQLLERYGMTETMMNLSNPLHGERRVGSVGLPLPQVEVRIVDPESEKPLPGGEVGEVQVRGPHVFKGYWRMESKTAESFTADGWLRTGDLGMLEPDGYFTLKGRSKDLIITGGLNVYPPEVEFVLAEHPAVLTSAVVGCPDDDWGEKITAVIILRDGYAPSEKNIMDYCREKLAAYKIPRRVLFVDELPRNSIGKVQKARLRAQVCS
ncbi:MAG: malonyl-CoA/methylmalonyl-CoA synthetase [Cellvibrionaceae bacterium]|jgi:malonyl-CoA/methylmalonyl-CoA synthetase